MNTFIILALAMIIGFTLIMISKKMSRKSNDEIFSNPSYTIGIVNEFQHRSKGFYSTTISVQYVPASVKYSYIINKKEYKYRTVPT